MFKKTSILLIWTLLVLSTLSEWIVNAGNYSIIASSVANKFQDWRVIKVVEQAGIQYINSFSWAFDGWKGKNPQIIGNPVPYYADDETYPVALEWKVSCLRNEDCGRVIISTDKKLPIVIEAATEGKANYETLGTNRANVKNRFYYFSPFEQYVDTDDASVESIVGLSPWENMGKSIKRAQIKEKQNKNKEAKKQFINNSSGWYSQTGATVANVPSANNGATCTSPIPCYNQFPFNYNGTICAVGCWPTALTQILAYHDRRGTFPNLFPNIIASATTIDQTTTNSIRTYMGTVCNNTTWQGDTVFINEWNGLRFARDKGYINTILPSLITSNIFYNIRINVNNGRPMIINAGGASGGHIFVAYGWNTDTVWVNQIHVNYGWGPGTPDAWITETSIPALPGMRVLSVLPVVITP
jgi:hypothetical protein